MVCTSANDLGDSNASCLRCWAGQAVMKEHVIVDSPHDRTGNSQAAADQLNCFLSDFSWDWLSIYFQFKVLILSCTVSTHLSDSMHPHTPLIETQCTRLHSAVACVANESFNQPSLQKKCDSEAFVAIMFPQTKPWKTVKSYNLVPFMRPFNYWQKEIQSAEITSHKVCHNSREN